MAKKHQHLISLHTSQTQRRYKYTTAALPAPRRSPLSLIPGFSAFLWLRGPSRSLTVPHGPSSRPSPARSPAGPAAPLLLPWLLPWLPPSSRRTARRDVGVA